MHTYALTFFENRVSDLNIQNLADDLAVSNDIRDPSLCSCSVFHLPPRCFETTAQEEGVAKMDGGAKRLKRCTDWSDSDRRFSNSFKMVYKLERLHHFSLKTVPRSCSWCMHQNALHLLDEDQTMSFTGLRICQNYASIFEAVSTPKKLGNR